MADLTHDEFLDRLYQELPRIYRQMDVDQQYQLKRYLDILVSGGLEPLMEETKGLANLMDYDKIPKEYLPFLASVLGFEYPYDLDEQTQRTYIRSAVAGYKRKGTVSALTFMIRELTRFKTTIDVFNDERRIDVTLEVDLNRQDFNKAVDKVAFLVQEYAPPVKIFNLINTFTWMEELINDFTDNEIDPVDIVVPDTDTDYESTAWLISNADNPGGYTPTGEHYFSNEIVDDLTDTVGFDDDSVAEPYTLATNLEEEADNTMTIQEADEIDTHTRDDIYATATPDAHTLTMAMDNIDYEAGYDIPVWFGSNIGLTNDTTTYSDNNYLQAIVEEIIPDKITIA